MRIDVITLFPRMFDAITQYGITARAFEQKLYDLHLWNPREYAKGLRRNVDDRPYGGGPGMVMMAEPLFATYQAVKKSVQGTPPLIYIAPDGECVSHHTVKRLSSQPSIVLLCGRYEGVDQRFIDSTVSESLSIGDFVLSGGELAAMCLMDAIVRQLPGALGDPESVQQESFVADLLDWPHYTRPPDWQGSQVPEVLLQGDHKLIDRWRREHAVAKTARQRPDLLHTARQSGQLNATDELYVSKMAKAK